MLRTIFAVWDTETTSNKPTEDDIISIGAVICEYKNGEFLKLDENHWYVHTSRKIDPAAYAVHRISAADLIGKDRIDVVLKNLTLWVQKYIYSNRDRLVMVAHNGRRFDDILLYCNCMKNKIDYNKFLSDIQCYGFMDSIKFIKGVLKGQSKTMLPTDVKTERVSYTLGNCYTSLCNKNIEDAHDALGDSRALYEILNSEKLASIINIHKVFEYVVPIAKGVGAIKQSTGVSFQIMSGEVCRQSTNQNSGCRERLYESDEVLKTYKSEVTLCLSCVTFVPGGTMCECRG